MIVLVDYSWLNYRSKFAYRNLKCEKSGVVYNTGALFGMYQSISTIFTKHNNVKMFLCLDGIPRKQIQEQVTYKANRNHETSVDTLDLDYFRMAKAFTIIPQVKIAYSPNLEADETIAFLCEMIEREKDEPIIIFSTDYDLRQLVDDEKKIFCSSQFDENGEGFVIEHEDHVISRGSSAVNGLYPKSIALYKAICGDTSDNITGVPHFPKALAKLLCNEYRTIEGLKAYLSAPERRMSRHAHAYQVLLREWSKIESNYILTKIDPSDVPEITNQAISLEDGVAFFTYYEAVKCLSGIRKLISQQS